MRDAVPLPSGDLALTDFVYDVDQNATAWTETRTYHGTGNTHTLEVSDVRRFSGVAATVLNNSAATGKGILGADVAIPAGTVFSDPDADFEADGVQPGQYLFLAVSEPGIAEAGGEPSVLNLEPLRIAEVTPTQLTLEEPLAAETPLPGNHFEYRIVREGYSLKAYSVRHTDPQGVTRTYHHAPFQ